MSEHVNSKTEQLSIDNVVSYNSISKTNQEGLFTGILQHSHEEADILNLRCYEIAKRNSLNQSIIYSPGMDVFLLLIFHYPSLPNALIFHTGKRPNLSDISIGSCHKALGICHAHALLGFIHLQVLIKLDVLCENPKLSGGKML